MNPLEKNSTLFYAEKKLPSGVGVDSHRSCVPIPPGGAIRLPTFPYDTHPCANSQELSDDDLEKSPA